MGLLNKTIRVRARKGALEPLEKINITEGKEYSVAISEIPSEKDIEAFRAAAGGWKGKVDAKKLLRDIRASRNVLTRPEPEL